MLDALGQIAHRGRRALAAGDLDQLAELFAVAHELLGALGVSRPALDSLCAAAVEHGARAAKLTGAGGGGCVIALCDTAAAASEVVRGLASLVPPSTPPSTLPFAVEVEP